MVDHEQPATAKDEALESHWKPTFRMFYQAYYQELVSEALIGRWRLIDFTTGLFVAFTASGSAVAGLTLWQEPGLKGLWAVIAILAAVASVIRGLTQVPDRLKSQEDARKVFSRLRFDLETFSQELKNGLANDAADSRYAGLRQRLTDAITIGSPDIALTPGLRNRVQDQLDEILKREDYIE